MVEGSETTRLNKANKHLARNPALNRQRQSNNMVRVD